MLGDHRPRQHAAGVAHQVFEQGIFLRRQLDPSSPAGHLTRGRIQDQVLHLKNTRGLARAPPQERAHAGHQFLNGKGLREVVVGAGIQPLHLLVELGAGGENQDGRGHLLLAQGLEDVEAGHPRQHEVENNQVVAPRPGEVETRGPVAARINGVALLLQRPPDEGGHLGLVLNDQNPHT